MDATNDRHSRGLVSALQLAGHLATAVPGKGAGTRLQQDFGCLPLKSGVQIPGWKDLPRDSIVIGINTHIVIASNNPWMLISFIIKHD